MQLIIYVDHDSTVVLTQLLWILRIPVMAGFLGTRPCCNANLLGPVSLDVWLAHRYRLQVQGLEMRANCGEVGEESWGRRGDRRLRTSPCPLLLGKIGDAMRVLNLTPRLPSCPLHFALTTARRTGWYVGDLRLNARVLNRHGTSKYVTVAIRCIIFLASD